MREKEKEEENVSLYPYLCYITQNVEYFRPSDS